MQSSRGPSPSRRDQLRATDHRVAASDTPTAWESFAIAAAFHPGTCGRLLGLTQCDSTWGGVRVMKQANTLPLCPVGSDCRRLVRVGPEMLRFGASDGEMQQKHIEV